MIEQLMQHLKVKNYAVAGISYGGFVAYDLMARQNPINKAIILASSGPVFMDEDIEALLERVQITTPEQLFVPNNEIEVKRLLNLVQYEPLPIPDFIAKQIYTDYFSQFKSQRTQLIQSLFKDRARLQAIETTSLPPVLLIWGNNDEIFPRKTGIALSRHLNAPLIVLPETGHTITNQHPDQVSQLIQDFLSPTK